MKLVVDTNVLITFFWKDSVLRQLLYHQEITFYSPEYALEEINKYSQDIIKKAEISIEEFEKQKKELAAIIYFMPLEEYNSYFNSGSEITPDLKDIDFVALALALQCPLWTNDKKLKDIKKIDVLTTKDIIDLI